MKRLLALVLLCVLTFSMSIPTFAMGSDINEAKGLRSTATTVGPRAATVPTEAPATLPYTAIIDELEEQQCTYTRYYFPAPNGTLTLSYSIYPSGSEVNVTRSFTIYLYRVGDNALIKTISIEDFTETVTDTYVFTGLNSNSNYYLMFENSSSVNPFRTKNVTGTVIISND